MEERNDAFDSAIREKMSGHEPVVPHALWTRISAELNESEEVATPAMPQIVPPASATPWWRVAAAAAVILTVGAASLLFILQPESENMTAAAKPAGKNAPAATVATQTPETPQVAVALTPAIEKKATTPVVPKTALPAISKSVADKAPEPKATQIVTPAAGDNDAALASAPAVSPASTLDMGNVPAFSLKRLSSPESLNDEITIIKSAPSKKKHHKHNGDEETTRVIILNKKFESQPDIRYQLPVRF